MSDDAAAPTLWEVQALVVDNGSSMCKAGFAGDDAPDLCSLPLLDALDTKV